jgi:hypothetical protein
MTIASELDQLLAEHRKQQDVFEARALLQQIRENIVVADARVQALVDNGMFDTIPASVKQSLSSAWSAIKTCRASLAATSVSEVLDWRI